MQIIHSISQMQKIVVRLKKEGKSIGFVPTMGALHEGHLSLIRRARKENDVAVISIFVNPTQFGPKEDFKKYPRAFSKDKKLAQDAGVDIIFYPTAKQIYPQGYQTYVEVEKLTKGLCGKSRAGHFRGVTTVVTKLFNTVPSDAAYFGQKDYQQAQVIKQMVKDLNIPIKIIIMPMVREPDGLAMSSRNAHLNCEERKAALVLNKSLQIAQKIIKSNYKISPQNVINKIESTIKKEPLARIDYVKVVDAQTLEELKQLKGKCVIALAVWIGKTRLIDNVILKGSRYKIAFSS